MKRISSVYCTGRNLYQWTGDFINVSTLNHKECVMSDSKKYPRVHNAAWPGVVGKEPGTDHPPIDLDTMLKLTAQAEVNGRKFDGIDLFLADPHTSIDSNKDDIKKLVDK